VGLRRQQYAKSPDWGDFEVLKKEVFETPSFFLNNIEISLSYKTEQGFISKNMTFVMFLD
jgi:hypothetical protein